MKKLMEQILKFGIVGVICFFIDYLVGIAAMNIAMIEPPPSAEVTAPIASRHQ